MPIFYFLDQRAKVSMMEGYINHHQDMERIRGSISIKNEYQNLIGQEYKENQQKHGKMMVGSRHLRNADIKAVEKMYANGWSYKATINTVMKNSPMTTNMTPIQKMVYRERLGRYMKKVEPLRKEIQRSKQKHGITSNRVKDIRDYAKCVQAQKSAVRQGVKVKPLTYQKFMTDKSPDSHKRYQARVQKKVQNHQKITQAQKTAKQAQKSTVRHRI